ncbi:flagellar hook capping FlgD N-terminal domain-containing protein [Stratiformator vulcanicus]|uniref:Basal-body rod modification protein FlgD n=1 Tax=Stratiformator vulcanicus TaxID=2527980 RepID=A0A517R594_9PLAN|nr:flagellar hook capping FlgD N-terminal domain-containing protein [Stratiformator vulcanicus]QDT39054.1 flagellar basal body rod modification protein [Stratiformator vulcanicus]
MSDAITSATNAVQVVDADKTGFNALTSEDFLELLIVQLQNQDPSEPVSNEELLGQISTMRQLQADLELTETLEAITSDQLLTSAASLIGKSVAGTDVSGAGLSGVVEKAFLTDGEAYVQVDSTPMKLADVLEVASAA